MITVCKKRHPEKSITLAATHSATRDLSLKSPAHVEPLKIIKVDAFGVALNPLHGRTAGFHRTQLRLHVITEDGLDVQELVRLVGLVGLV